MDPAQQAKLTERIDELTAELAERDAAFGPLKVQLDAAKSALAESQAEAESAKQSSQTASETLNGAVTAYKAMLVSSNPAIPAGLIKGDTIEAVNASLTDAQGMVEKVREILKAEAGVTPVSAGAPGRQTVDPMSLSPAEKIKWGLENQPYQNKERSL